MTAIPSQITARPAHTDDAPTYDARELLQDARLVRIILDEQVYTLRLTKAEKLILTK